MLLALVASLATLSGVLAQDEKCGAGQILITPKYIIGLGGTKKNLVLEPVFAKVKRRECISCSSMRCLGSTATKGGPNCKTDVGCLKCQEDYIRFFRGYDPIRGLEGDPQNPYKYLNAFVCEYAGLGKNKAGTYVGLNCNKNPKSANGYDAKDSDTGKPGGCTKCPKGAIKQNPWWMARPVYVNKFNFITRCLDFKLQLKCATWDLSVGCQSCPRGYRLQFDDRVDYLQKISMCKPVTSN